MALYTPDATIESPLVTHLLNQEFGICHDAIKQNKCHRYQYHKPPA